MRKTNLSTRLFFIFNGIILLSVLANCGSSNSFLRARRSNSKTNNEEFEKFFLKASKSVPRIGRRGSVDGEYYPERDVYNFYGPMKYKLQRSPFPPSGQIKRSVPNNLGAPFWSDIAKIYEYNPELPMILNYLSNIEQEQGDDPSTYDLLKMKPKKMETNYVPPKEVLEYRLQPEV